LRIANKHEKALFGNNSGNRVKNGQKKGRFDFVKDASRDVRRRLFVVILNARKKNYKNIYNW